VGNKLAKSVKKSIKKSTTPSDDEQRLIAAQCGHLDVVKFLVKQQAEVNAKNTGGWTPLHLAAQNGHLDVVKFLVEQQAEVNARLDTDGWTPLHSAAQNGYLDAP
jgi:ankyrin repeat protein